MSPNTTPPITGNELPRLGWHHSEPFDVVKFEPVTRVPAEYLAMYTKPNGGLWTTPLNEVAGIVCNSWVAFHGTRRFDRPLWEIHPQPGAKVFVVDHPDDLADAVRRYPDPRNTIETFDPDVAFRLPDSALVDWPAMAQDFDAFYLTTDGVRHLNSPDPMASLTNFRGRRTSLGQHLALWDVITVLWLNPAFTVGTAHPGDPDTVRRYKEAADAAELTLATEIRSKIIASAADNGVELPQHLLDMSPIGFMMVMARVASQGDTE